MTVQAKFKCESVLHTEGEQVQVALRAAYGPGNESWSKLTPSGSMMMTITNPALINYFKPGRMYLLNIEEAV